MALEQNFTLPEKGVSETETKKRNELIEWFSATIDNAVVGFIVSGSMGYGYDYSVKETSDVDMQLIITPQTINKLKESSLFDPIELEKIITGYLEGVYAQFSLVLQKNGVNLECHFWDSAAFIAAITYQARDTRRLRTSVDTPSTDHGFSFARDESVKDYYGEMISGYAVSVFPSYREEKDTLYLCRPITNILGLPRVVKTNQELDCAITKTWEETIHRLSARAENGKIDLMKHNIINTLPGKNKMRQDVLKKIQQKTRELLEAKGWV